MAEELDNKEQRHWGKVRKKIKFDSGDSGLSSDQEKLLDKYLGRGIKATPKKERVEDINILLPKQTERESE